jgi:predicted CoA-binding protein
MNDQRKMPSAVRDFRHGLPHARRSPMGARAAVHVGDEHFLDRQLERPRHFNCLTARFSMANTPESVASFLRGRRFAVAGVSRHSGQAANAVFLKLRRAGYEVFPINPKASEVEGTTCYSELGAVPGQLDGVVIATAPGASAQVVRQCTDRGVRRVWFHRSFGNGSVSEEAVRECNARGIECIVGGCPLMFCEPVDFGHRCMRAWLQWQGRVPK